MLGAIEIKLIIAVLFLLASAISSWMKKRKEAEAEKERSAPPHRPHSAGSPPLQQPAQPVSWEEELRRLLQGETPGPQPIPPPIVVHETHRPAPPPLAPPEPEPVHRHRTVFDVVEESNPVDVDVQPRFQPMPELTESAYAYSQASQLGQKVEGHLRQVTEHPVGTTSVARKVATPEAAAALALLRRPHLARTAILASIIIGPPRALAD